MTTPRTESRVQIAAIELDVRKASAINAHLIRPIAILPSKVGDPVLPFAIGAWAEIRPLLKPDGSATALRRAVGAYLHSTRYYFATAHPDSRRHDVDGHPLDVISDDDRLAAQRNLKTLNQKDTSKEAPPEEATSLVQISKAEKIRASLFKTKMISP